MIGPSTRARYALRAMIELALREGSGPVLLRQVAQAQHLSAKYLEQLTIPLRRQGLLQAERGPQGGYELARPAAEITAREIVEAVEVPLHFVECIPRPQSCDRTATCAARDLWAKAGDAVAAVLSQTTLADLRERQLSAQAETAACYQI